MKKLIKISKKISILILMISLIGCTNDDAELPKVIAGFTYTLNIDTGTVTFINISENSRSYLWTFGDESTSKEINPIKTYANGTYTVTLKASNAAGASNLFEDEIIISIPEVATLPISFDGENTSYDTSVFGGASFEIVDNPDPSGSNTSTSKVGAITNVGAAFEGFFIDLGLPIDLSTNKTIKANFWSNTPIDVLLKLEEGTGAPTESTASHGGTGWEDIYFTFDSAGSYSRFTMFVDGPGTTSGTFYLDDIVQIATQDIPCPQTNLELPIDFDCNGIDYAAKIVGNVSFEVVDNPELSGINSGASKVGKMTNVGQNWENAFFNLDTAIDFTTDKGIKFKLFSDQALPIKVKLEDGTEAPIEVDVDHTGSGWEELTFTFMSVAAYNDMIIFVDGPGTAAGTFYIDDIEQVAGDVGDPCDAETMQSLAGADLNLTFMSDPTASIIEDGGDFEWIDNPDFDNDINKSCKVGKITKLGNNPWDNNQIDLDAKLDFNANEGLKIKVWSGIANTEVRIKLEEIGNPGNNAEQFLTTSVTSAWEELTFPFTNADSDKFNKIVIFFDLNASNTDTYYFDDFALYGTGGGGACTDTMLALPIDFDCETLDYVSKDTGDVAFEVIDNPELSGINATPSKVAKLVFDANQPWENMNLNLDTPISFVTDDSVKFKLFSSTPRAIKLKFETGGAAVENDQNHSGSGWEELTFTLASAESYSNLIVFVDGGSDTVGTFYIDDIEQVTSGGGGGGDCPAPPAGDLISNGDFEAGEVCWQLIDNGGTVSISTTVSNGGGSNSVQIRTAPGKNPGVKQERFAAGTALPNTEYKVTFDIKADASTPLVDGAVFQAFVFSEGAEGGATGAVQHVLVQGLGSVSTSWETKTYMFVSGGAPVNVEGGFSFLAELVCGGAGTCDGIINIDNVSITLN